VILIAKGEAPQDLITDGIVATRALCDQFRADAAAYETGAKLFSFRSGIYASRAVKTALEAVHSAKCCYCERSITGFGTAHVEHWRPKAYSQQARGAAQQRPGYFWLAYEWSNLFLSCDECNCKKGNTFPLADPSKRARSHLASLEEETPVILSPGGPIDPRAHIVFHQEVPKGLTELGKRTIEVVGLDLNREDRLSYLNLIRVQKRWADHGDDGDARMQRFAREAREFLEKAVQPETAFSAMATDFLRQRA
jgi:5-methylcytosine-specific restriction endonuclease McrA